MIWPFDVDWFPWLSSPAEDSKPEPSKPVISRTPPGVLRVSESFSLDLQPFKDEGERDAILASSGKGKSYLTGVLMEETLENNGVLCVIDPEGEHHTLFKNSGKGKTYPGAIVGGRHADLALETACFEKYLQTMLKNGLSFVFDLSGMVHEEQREYYITLIDTLFIVQEEHKRKIKVVVDEARIYAPQSSLGKNEANPLMASQNIAQLGRKRGIDSIWATQRPANINKDILSQCNRFWFGGLKSLQDYNQIKGFLSDAGITREQIMGLDRGNFYLFCNDQTRLIQVRKRYCKHAGSTPQADTSKPVASKRDLKGILESLK